MGSQSTSITRKYEIEATSLRRVLLADGSVSNSTTIAPDSISDERTARAEVVVEVELREPGEQARVLVNMEVRTKSATARSDETLDVPGTIDLSTILTEHEPTGTLTSAITLLRLPSGDGDLKVAVE